jgi:hypothetical protein
MFRIDCDVAIGINLKTELSLFLLKAVDFSPCPIASVYPIDMIPIRGDVAFKPPDKSLKDKMPFFIYAAV